jgi:hypothetical protein
MSPLAFRIVWAIGLLVFAAIIAARARLLLRARCTAGDGATSWVDYGSARR